MILFIICIASSSFILTDLLQIPNQEDKGCLNKFIQIANNFTTDSAALPMLLNSGKNVNDLGNYIACNQNNASKYITMQVLHLPVLMSLGICGPKECSENDYSVLKQPIAGFIEEEMKKVNPNYRVNESDVVFNDPQNVGGIGKYFIIAIFVYAAMLILSIVGSIFKNQTVFKCFDIVSNLKEIFESIKREDNSLSIFDGLRTVSMFWVVFGHIFYTQKSSPLLVFTKINDFAVSFWNAYIYNATLSVDVFFFLSAFLLSYVLMKKFKSSNGKISMVQIIIHRLLRLYPLMIFVFLLYSAIIPAMGFGPIFSVYNNEINECKNGWYYSFLFIKNIFAKNPCYGWAWYLSNDMQYFITSLLIIYIFSKKRIAGYLSALATLIGCIIGAMIVAHQKKLSNSIFKYNAEFFEYYYMPYVRAPAYLVGLIAGFWFYQYKSNESQVITNIANKLLRSPKILYSIAAFGFVAAIADIQLLYFFDKYVDKITLWEDVMQFALSRPLFTLFLLMMITPTLLGKGVVLPWVFNHSFWEISSKLTYAAYLIHLIVVKYKFATITYSYQYSLLETYFSFWGFAIVIYALSIAFTALFESPIVKLEMKYIFPRRKRVAIEKHIDEELAAISKDSKN